MEKGRFSSPKDLSALIQAARGTVPCDVVVKGAKFLDVFNGSFQEGDIAILGNTIVGIGDSYSGKEHIDAQDLIVVPGFVDTHVHIESSLMTPATFAKAVLPCGTTTAIWDPHEIANVWGKEGIEWALASSENVGLDVFVMVPSCVPSTSPELGLETSGAVLRQKDLSSFRGHPRVLGLAEMMNFPGLLHQEADVVGKLVDYKDMKRDGHCPGLRGKDLNAYGVAGVHSCHESTTLDEAYEKMMKGIHVLIREGSCAKDAATLLPLLNSYSSAVLGFCSDDRNPLDIAETGHIDCIVNMGLKKGLDPASVFRAATYSACRQYGLLDRGAVAPGYLADLVFVRPLGGDMKNGVEITRVIKNGRDIKELKVSQSLPAKSRKNLNMKDITLDHFSVRAKAASGTVVTRVIEVIPNQILTKKSTISMLVDKGSIANDLERDVLKIAVLERHHQTGGYSVALVQGFGIKEGAIATSINHDSHNVIVVGSSDEYMLQAVNELRAIDGGIVVVGKKTVEKLACPIGGLMSVAEPRDVKEGLERLKKLAREIGCVLSEPFLQLSFLALPVIPSLKITDKGLVDVDEFRVVTLVVD
ncbi:MAG: adenine deaminase [Oligoflexales bacterium]